MRLRGWYIVDPTDCTNMCGPWKRKGDVPSPLWDHLEHVDASAMKTMLGSGEVALTSPSVLPDELLDADNYRGNECNVGSLIESGIGFRMFEPGDPEDRFVEGFNSRSNEKAFCDVDADNWGLDSYRTETEFDSGKNPNHSDNMPDWLLPKAMGLFLKLQTMTPADVLKHREPVRDKAGRIKKYTKGPRKGQTIYNQGGFHNWGLEYMPPILQGPLMAKIRQVMKPMAQYYTHVCKIDADPDNTGEIGFVSDTFKAIHEIRAIMTTDSESPDSRWTDYYYATKAFTDLTTVGDELAEKRYANTMTTEAMSLITDKRKRSNRTALMLNKLATMTTAGQVNKAYWAFRKRVTDMYTDLGHGKIQANEVWLTKAQIKTMYQAFRDKREEVKRG